MRGNKRFDVVPNDENFLEITDDEVNLNQFQVCALLNELSFENKMLKLEIDFLKRKLSNMHDDILDQINYANQSGVCSVNSLKELL